MTAALLLLGIALGADVSGRVVDEAGAPVQGATIQAYDQQFVLVDGATDADGAFRLEGLEPGVWRLRALPAYRDNLVTRWHPSAQDFCDSEAVLLDGADAGGLEFRLPAGAEVAGRLLDSAGEPVVSAIVWASGGAPDTENLSSRGALTNAQGEFLVRGLDAPLDAATSDWLLTVQADDFPEQLLGGVYDSELAAPTAVPTRGRADVGEHTLLDGILVTGQVVGPDGPVPEADVRVYSASQVVNVTTDANGRYAALGLPPGDVLSWVNAPGVALTYWPDGDRPVEFLPAPDEGDVLEDVDLFPPAELTLLARVTDDTGQPVVGMQGLLYNDTRTVGRGNLTDDTGLLVIDSLHPGDYTLFLYGASFDGTNDWARDNDGQERVFTLAASTDGQVVDLVLPPSTTLSGVVLDERGEPLYNATVVARQVVADGVEGAAAAALTDRAGAYRIPGMPPGDYTIEAGVAPLCEGDPSYVTVFWPDQVNADWARTVPLQVGVDQAELDLQLPSDDDRDGMGDRWEERYGLDPWRNDALEDNDGDTYQNYTEYLLGTNPSEFDDDRTDCGCGSAGASVVLLPLLGLARRRRRA